MQGWGVVADTGTLLLQLCWELPEVDPPLAIAHKLLGVAALKLDAYLDISSRYGGGQCWGQLNLGAKI
jgi:hypothetical protein